MTKGRAVGEHIGLAFYTIGQRKGIGIGGAGEAWYVADKRIDSNELVVVQGHDHPLLMKKALSAADAAWVAGRPPQAPSTPYGENALPPGRCAVHAVERAEEDEIKVEFPRRNGR